MKQYLSKYILRNILIYLFISRYILRYSSPPSSPSHPKFPLSPPQIPSPSPPSSPPYQPPTPTPSIQVLLIVPPALPPSLALPHPLAVTPPIIFQYRVNLDVYHRYSVSCQYNYVPSTVPNTGHDSPVPASHVKMSLDPTAEIYICKARLMYSV